MPLSGNSDRITDNCLWKALAQCMARSQHSVDATSLFKALEVPVRKCICLVWEGQTGPESTEA